MEKTCRQCANIKDVSQFNHDSHSKDGLSYYCKDCSREKSRVYYTLHSKKCNQRSHDYYIEHKEELNIKSNKRNRTNPKRVYDLRKHNAKNREILWNISFEWYLINIWDKQCVYGNHPSNGGIDRIDSNGEYEPNNCVPCCFWCNSIKNAHTTSEMYNHIISMLSHKKEDLLNNEDFVNMCLWVTSNFKI